MTSTQCWHCKGLRSMPMVTQAGGGHVRQTLFPNQVMGGRHIHSASALLLVTSLQNSRWKAKTAPNQYAIPTLTTPHSASLLMNSSDQLHRTFDWPDASFDLTSYLPGTDTRHARGCLIADQIKTRLLWSLLFTGVVITRNRLRVLPTILSLSFLVLFQHQTVVQSTLDLTAQPYKGGGQLGK